MHSTNVLIKFNIFWKTFVEQMPINKDNLFLIILSFLINPLFWVII